MKSPTIIEPALNGRFTMDGDDALEQRLAELCRVTVEAVRSLIPATDLQAIVLGGGYGRGEGGVLRVGTQDHPYNDLDFYVFLRRGFFWRPDPRERRLDELGERLSATAGLHVEFKLDVLSRFRRRAVSMFSYDLVSKHRVVFGPPTLFQDCPHHRESHSIPSYEATRLLMNRCSGLLLATAMLERRDSAAADFVTRNVAKAKLALGDAVLTACGLYHWSACRRYRVLASLPTSSRPPWLEQLLAFHAAGLEFKLHPHPAEAAHETLAGQVACVSQLALQVWLWLEGRRLGQHFASAHDYAFHRASKHTDTPRWRNYLSSWRAYGPRAAFDPLAWRSPRERLLVSLCLLLWQRSRLTEPPVLRHLQKHLRSAEIEPAELLRAHERLRRAFG